MKKGKKAVLGAKFGHLEPAYKDLTTKMQELGAALLQQINSIYKVRIEVLVLIKYIYWEKYFYVDCHSGTGILFYPCPKKPVIIRKLFFRILMS